MKLHLFFLFVSLYFPVCEGKSQNNCNPEVIFKTTLTGGYNLQESDNDTYFLLDCNIINNTDSTIQFLTHSCAISAYVVTDNKAISVCKMNCSGNFLTRISLKPNQSISFPIILKTNYDGVKTKLGFVFLTHHEDLDSIEYSDVFSKSKTKLENILWSNQVKLVNGQGFPYKIR